jgi:hypothetical protein
MALCLTLSKEGNMERIMLRRGIIFRPAILVIAMAAVLLTFATGGAFGAAASGSEKVTVESLKINGKAVSDGEPGILLYKQLLPGGKVYVSGRAASKEGEIVSVDISRDNGKTWRKASLLKDGFFEYGFRLKADGRSVVCVKAQDSKGGQNNVAATCAKITVSEKNVYMLVREVLDEMIEAYENRNLQAFMAFIGDDFYGDKTVLDSAIRAAANLYHDVDIRYTMNSVVPDYVDKVFASVTFNRRYTEVKTGRTLTDGGTTAFIFRFEGGRLKVISMARPLMFFQ